MGPIIGVPNDVAQRLKEETDLVEVDQVPPEVVELDVQLGSTPEDRLILTETPETGYGLLISMITMSDYATTAPNHFELTVRDQDGNPKAFSASAVNGASIRDHLKCAYYGEVGNRHPLIPA